jgi:hypothetical protein
MAWKPSYVTVAELADWIEADETDTRLPFAVAAASRAVDRHCHAGGLRQFGKVAAPEQRFYTPRWSRRRGRWVLTTDDFQTVTGLAVNLDLDGSGSFADAVTDSQKLPLNAAQEGQPWTHLVLPESVNGQLCGAEGEVAVTALWGWTDVPVSVKTATLLQGARVFTRKVAAFGIAGTPESGESGGLRLLAKIDPDAAVMLREYRRREWALG